MEKFVTLTYQKKLYKMPLTPELNTSLMYALGDYYAFNENGCLIRKTKDIKQTIEINKIIQKVFEDLLSTYELDEEVKEFLESSKVNMPDENFIAAHAYISSVDNLILIYNDVYKSKKEQETSEKKKEQTETLNTDLSKDIRAASNDASKNIYLAYKVLLRASKDDRFKSFITEDKIEQALKKIVICKSQQEFEKIYIELTEPKNAQDKEQVKKTLTGLAAFNNPNDGKTYIKQDCRLEVIVHELIHFLSLNGDIPGLKEITYELTPDDINEKSKLNERAEIIKIVYAEALNEAVTRYLTQKILPELNVSDAYNYGAAFLDKYAKALQNSDIDIEQELFKAYFKGNKKSLNYIIENINYAEPDYWFKILDSMVISQQVHMFLMDGKNLNEIQSLEEIEKVLNKVRENITLKITGQISVEPPEKLESGSRKN